VRSGEFIAVMIRNRTGWETAIASPRIGEVGRLRRVGFASFAPILDLRPFAWVIATFQPSLFARQESIHLKQINFRTDVASSPLHRSHAYVVMPPCRQQVSSQGGEVIAVTKVTVNQVVPRAGVVKGT
jgi:hypothetical protein